jgi:hypothetical protein
MLRAYRYGYGLGATMAMGDGPTQTAGVVIDAGRV